MNHQTHFTLEPSLGIRPWWEIGGYFQMALRATARSTMPASSCARNS
jgi:hypothetical protein